MDEEGRRILSASGHICIEVIMVVGYGGLGMVEDMVLDELRLRASSCGAQPKCHLDGFL